METVKQGRRRFMFNEDGIFGFFSHLPPIMLWRLTGSARMDTRGERFGGAQIRQGAIKCVIHHQVIVFLIVNDLVDCIAHTPLNRFLRIFTTSFKPLLQRLIGRS